MKRIIALAFTFVFILSFSPAAEASSQSKPYAKVLVYSMAVDALGKIGDKRAKQCLLEALKSRHFFARAYAAKALGRLGDKSAIPFLKQLINDKHYVVRIAAVKSLIMLGDADAEKILLGFLYNNNEAIRATAVSGLDEFGAKFAPTLLRLLTEEKDPVVRSKIIEQFNDEELPVTAIYEKSKPGIDPRLQALREALNDKNWEIRQAACYGIALFKDKKSIPQLIKKLKDDNIYVRVAAKISLSKLGDKSVNKLLWEDIENKNPILRVSSFIALANLKDVKAIPVILKEIMKPKNSLHARKGSVRALMMLKGPGYEILD
ncbi:MAG: HEAT repeat domain-containing protein, partial [Candidatus Omnitrophica bacterium]|nr:HEAT repeat domain-containing protein [Candidatus Omnitrophota bacterium]